MKFINFLYISKSQMELNLGGTNSVNYLILYINKYFNIKIIQGLFV